MRAVFAILLMIWAPAVLAQGFSGLARVDGARSGLSESADAVELRLTLSQPVAWRVHMLDQPPRLVVDFREVDFAPMGTPDLSLLEKVVALRTGRMGPGWTRLVAELAGPYGLATSQMVTGAEDGSARVELRLEELSAEDFARAAGARPSPLFPEPALTARPAARPSEDGRLTVVLDPGHGGVDPGALRDGVSEADLMLIFARDVKESLLRSGNYDVILTRNDDSFVSLETRLTIARRAGADVFLSLHADAIEEGIAQGAQVYTLSNEASTEALAKLAHRHDREDILAGADLHGTDDQVAQALMEIARRETEPRIEALADAVVAGLRYEGVKLHKKPRAHGDFSVLKLPDIPAVLIEIAFLSSPSELKKLQNAEWRQLAAAGIARSVAAWVAEDERLKALIRQ
ncbi:N-acetylmuramoyl-L-alanine amidase [Vannielia sp.]|uniref:N-acetylmuramoyl-L-alanine amidase n=1 Tax=Vannielia sp. TaxID=2813045 RepID=UPI002616D1C3|nr:N-acetylmuramoyl-L-alanine amidase [Vannielia sp.]MDF1871579.1 N-acetylmuramoyl-L-alanine amidase [Vannielia sp.]